MTVAPITTRVRGIPTEVPLGRLEGLPKRCVANLDTLTTIAKATLTGQLAVLSPGSSPRWSERSASRWG